MKQPIEIASIRLGTEQELEDAVDLAERFLAFNQPALDSPLFEFSKELFVATALCSAAVRGDLSDVVKIPGLLAGTPNQIDHYLSPAPGSSAGRTWFMKFLRALNSLPSAAEASKLYQTCFAQWQLALSAYQAAHQEYVKQLLATQDKPADLFVVADPSKVDADADHKHPAFQKTLQLAKARKNVLLVGPAGTGKTTLASQVAAELGLDFASISVTAGMSVSQLTGWIMPGGYLQSDFVRLYENGGVFLMDEMDAADANTLTIINQALSNGGFHIAQRTDKTEVKKHPDFICIAAANTYGTGGDLIYAGREQLDAATLDRFMNVYVDYDRQLEKKRCDPEVLNFAHAVRDAILKLKLRRVMSTRKAIDLSDMKRGAAKWTLDECKDCYFTGWSQDEKAKLQNYVS